jgi:RHS repeat-associated protein
MPMNRPGYPPVRYNLEDHLGTSCVELDGDGTLINREEYYPFGDTCFGAFGKKRYRYVGKERDGESGLYYYGARYYAAWVGRFVSVDPLAASYAHLNPYNYAGNKPIGDLDVDGMQSRDEVPGPDASSSHAGQIPDQSPGVASFVLPEVEIIGTSPYPEGHTRTNTLTLTSVDSRGIPHSQTLSETQYWHTGGGYPGREYLSGGWKSEQEYMTLVFRPLLNDYHHYVYGETPGAPWEGSGSDIVAFNRYADFVLGRDRLADWIGPTLSEQSAEMGPPAPYAPWRGMGGLTPVYPEAEILMFGRALFQAGAKVAAEPLVEQYSLRATKSGFYPVMTRGSKAPTSLTWLEKGEVWKFGTTKNPLTRYPQSYLDNIGEYGVSYKGEFSGALKEALSLERMKILNFKLQSGGLLPPGNKIIR